MGPYGWLYIASDFMLGVLTVLFALGLRRAVQDSGWKRLGIAALLVFGFGFIFGSAPCDCLPGQPLTLSGQIHNMASLALLIATLPMSLLMGLAYRRDDRWRRYAWYSIITGILAPVLFVTANALPPTFSWFYLWLLLIPFAWLEVNAPEVLYRDNPLIQQVMQMRAQAAAPYQQTCGIPHPESAGFPSEPPL